jgi:hypothetical protein
VCGPSLDCDGDSGICTHAQLDDETKDRRNHDIALDDAGVRADLPEFADPKRGLLGAAYAQGPLDREVVMRNARRHYVVDAPAGGATVSCDDQLADGTPCTCRETMTYSDELCALPSDRTTVNVRRCALKIDDAHRRFGDPRRHCAVEKVETCIYDRDCCPGLHCSLSKCVRGDGG